MISSANAWPTVDNKPLEVGFVLPTVSASAGGGFTFSREIISALGSLRGDCRHGIYALVRENSELPNLNVPIIRLGQLQPRPWVARLVEGFSRLRLEVAKPSPVWTADGRALNRRIDVVVNLHPGVLDEADVFQVSTVWDLSHRYIPGFPEITHAGERANREAKFRKLIHYADFVITGTERGAEELNTYYGVERRRIFLIPHPTPSDAIELAASHRDAFHGRTSREPFALYPAQMWAHKNHLTLLRAWKNLRRRKGWSMKLVLPGHDYGNGSYLKQEAKKLGVEDLVEFPGFMPREALLDLYRRATLMVYPSLFGPENLPPLEAFALGCPVIASAIPGAEEQLGDAALLVDPLDDAAWAEAISRLADDSELQNLLIRKGNARALSFSGEDFARRILAMLDEIAKLRALWGSPATRA